MVLTLHSLWSSKRQRQPEGRRYKISCCITPRSPLVWEKQCLLIPSSSCIFFGMTQKKSFQGLKSYMKHWCG